MNNLRKQNQVLFYFGGFAPVGGIETFCSNLLSYLQLNHYSCHLLCWGQTSPLISLLENNKVKVTRSFWRWGCKWNLPDFLLLPLGIQSVKKANVVFLGKLFPYRILRVLRSQAKQKVKFIYMTPYKPSVPDHPHDQKRMLDSLNIFDLM